MKREFVDTYQHKGLRKKLVDLLKEKGITDTKVLDAMNAIPRHFFLDSAFDKIAYENRAFDIGAEQTISHPYTVAYQTQLLQVKKLEKVLEIGTGSMYQSAVLAELGVWLFSIERQKQLYDEKSKFFVRTKYHNTKFFYGDGFEGLATYAPFDKILITAAAPFIPPKLLTQLKVGGMMVIPLDEGNEQRMLRITKLADGSFQEESFEAFSFVPMLTGKNR
jgi:protein-L-isoaspartate(D-aspartate) O-methyltransferase